MGILGVDIGKKRTGLAWTDPAVGVILPFGFFVSTPDQVAKELGTIITNERITQVVIGLPLSPEGEENEACAFVRSIGTVITSTHTVEVFFEDERYTSRLAYSMGGEATKDEKAAMAILETYLHKKK
jgi:putative Holliday junction resolvase